MTAAQRKIYMREYIAAYWRRHKKRLRERNTRYYREARKEAAAALRGKPPFDPATWDPRRAEAFLGCVIET